jgi:hypothetical protein
MNKEDFNNLKHEKVHHQNPKAASVPQLAHGSRPHSGPQPLEARKKLFYEDTKALHIDKLCLRDSLAGAESIPPGMWCRIRLPYAVVARLDFLAVRVFVRKCSIELPTSVLDTVSRVRQKSED